MSLPILTCVRSPRNLTLLDHTVCFPEHLGRDGETDLLGGFQVHNQLVACVRLIPSLKLVP